MKNLNSKKVENRTIQLKKSKGLEQLLHQRGYMDNKSVHEKVFNNISHQVNINETMISLSLYLLEWQKKNDNTKYQQEQKATPLYIVGRNTKYYSLSRKQLWNSNKYTNTIRSNNSILRHICPGEMKTCLHKNLSNDIYRMTIENHLKKETIKCPSMNK